MSYQVLARKYRPSTFADLEGQEHVLQALINALDNERLHHAYLFTGTRGVGKTTIARILARCLNCETGVSATPCGECNNCQEILEGRSVDLIEIDAASRTGVDDMRELLDNVQYMPTVSRFKVYLIDEVHMLSRSSFNAMLKTLEEPPEHVKFLFATTDPKKLPITVLSRCLQFNLKNLTPEQVVHHLGEVLDREAITWDESALWQLGHAADGSMRDALSLTDQAISFGAGEVREGPVKAMLGSVDQREVYELLDAIVDEDGMKLLQKVAQLAEFAPDYAGLLDDLLAVLHRLAISKAVPGAMDNSQGDQALLEALADRVPEEHVQLLYQIGLMGQRDLPLAPMPRIGFEMTLLRMMSFAPAGTGSGDDIVNPQQEPAAGGDTPSGSSGSRSVENSHRGAGRSAPIAGLLDVINGQGASSAEVAEPDPGPAPEAPVPDTAEPEAAATLPDPEPEPAPEPAFIEQDREVPPLASANWAEIVAMMGLGGVTNTLASNCQLEQIQDNRCLLRLEEHHASLWNESHEGRIADALSSLYEKTVSVSINVGSIDEETPAARQQRLRDESMAKAVAEMQSDQHVQQLIENFNGKLDIGSVAPVGGNT